LQQPAVCLGHGGAQVYLADALALAGVVEDALAADRTLGGVVDRAEVTHSKGQEAIPEEHKHEFGITLTVSWAGETVA